MMDNLCNFSAVRAVYPAFCFVFVSGFFTWGYAQPGYARCLPPSSPLRAGRAAQAGQAARAGWAAQLLEVCAFQNTSSQPRASPLESAETPRLGMVSLSQANLGERRLGARSVGVSPQQLRVCVRANCLQTTPGEAEPFGSPLLIGKHL